VRATGPEPSEITDLTRILRASGYPALKPVLVDSAVYSELCEDGVKYCAASDTR
jgi:hypothetical protein